jgi:hypothetical protein
MYVYLGLYVVVGRYGCTRSRMRRYHGRQMYDMYGADGQMYRNWQLKSKTKDGVSSQWVDEMEEVR